MLNSVPGTIQATLYNARGQIAARYYSNGVATFYLYNPYRGWLTGVTHRGSAVLETVKSTPPAGPSPPDRNLVSRLRMSPAAGTEPVRAAHRTSRTGSRRRELPALRRTRGKLGAQPALD